MLKKKLKTKPKRSLKTKSSIRKRPSRKQRRNKKMYEDDSLLNIWNGNGFVMCGLGKKSRTLAKSNISSDASNGQSKEQKEVLLTLMCGACTHI